MSLQHPDAGHEVDEIEAESDHPAAPGSDQDLLLVANGNGSKLLVAQAIVLIVLGSCLQMLSLAAVFVIALMYSTPEQKYPVRLDFHSSGGYGLWLPFLPVAAGTLLLRAHRTADTSLFRLFFLTCGLTCVASCVLLVLRAVYYSNGWYQDLLDAGDLRSVREFHVQMACDSLLLVLGLCSPASLLANCVSGRRLTAAADSLSQGRNESV